MKKASNKQTVSYEPVAVSEETQVTFIKTVNAGGVTISGVAKKKTEDETVTIGSVSFDNEKDTLAVYINKKSVLTKEELDKLMVQTPGWIAEILAEEE